MLITLAEPFQRDADEPDENDTVSDPRKVQDSDIEEREINDFVGETDENEDREDVNDSYRSSRRRRRRKFTYNMV